VELLQLSLRGGGSIVNRQFKIVVEKHADGYVAYPIGMKGVVIGEAIPTRRLLRMSNRPSAFI